MFPRLSLSVLALGLWALQATAAPQHGPGGGGDHDGGHGGGGHGGGWPHGGDIGGDGYTRGHNHHPTTVPSSCNVVLHPGVTQRQPCHTVTETVSPTKCRPLHCPLIPHLVCPLLVRVTTTEVPCANECCPVTPTKYVTAPCAGCVSTCVIPTETLTVTTGCATTKPTRLPSFSPTTTLPPLTVPTTASTFPGGSLLPSFPNTTFPNPTRKSTVKPFPSFTLV